MVGETHRTSRHGCRESRRRARWSLPNRRSRLLGDLFALQPMEPRALKGMGASVQAFAVLGERASVSRFAARQADGMSPIVGREQELALLLERWSQARTGEGQVVLLTGEAGIGKSRLTEAMIDAVAAEPHVLIRYQCSPYHAHSALHPVIQHLAHAAGFAEGEAPDRRLDRIEAMLAPDWRQMTRPHRCWRRSWASTAPSATGP